MAARLRRLLRLLPGEHISPESLAPLFAKHGASESDGVTTAAQLGAAVGRSVESSVALSAKGGGVALGAVAFGRALRELVPPTTPRITAAAQVRGAHALTVGSEA
eukprot:SAG11_NODE_2099_length_3827_cov_1.669796_2_plen_105_part_00